MNGFKLSKNDCDLLITTKAIIGCFKDIFLVYLSFLAV